ncbi:rhodanese-like domain-containing protein [Kangiella shandongensis]|uniref:rhodanese-like domain-containing protein n=1 Tax=Kangiella shandongensis TaxID=2763258 RepID=UPI001CBD525A|nr:rhodanese-like domain-containing protein [Kangiella shandongensis]
MSEFIPQEQDKVQFIEATDLAQWLTQPDAPLVIDVSGEEEAFEPIAIKAKESLSLPIAEFASFINEWDPDEAVVVVCQLGQKSFNAAHRLIESDFSCVYSLHGGFEAWRRAINH